MLCRSGGRGRKLQIGMGKNDILVLRSAVWKANLYSLYSKYSRSYLMTTASCCQGNSVGLCFHPHPHLLLAGSFHTVGIIYCSIVAPRIHA